MVAFTEEEQMTQVHILAIDLAKRSFQVCGTDRGGAVLFNRVLTRARLIQLLNEQSPCIVAMEACATSHFWGRFAQSCGHNVRLIPPIYVKRFVKRQNNDAADAAAIAEAAQRHSCRVRMKRTFEPAVASTSWMFSSPGMPNM